MEALGSVSIEPRMTRIYTDGQQGDAQGTCAGDAFSNPSTSELARASGNTSLTRSARVPSGEKSESVLIHDIRGQNASSPATSHSLLATAPKVPMLDSRPSSLDSSSQALRAPYFMHPSVYHRGLHKKRLPAAALDARRWTPLRSSGGASASVSSELTTESFIQNFITFKE